MDIFNLFKKLENEKEQNSQKPISMMLVCLGNPGNEYKKTRHNAGFMLYDLLCKKYSLSPLKAKFHALYTEAVISNKRVLVMLPQTFMNSSGIAVKEAANFYKIAPENILIIVDDIMFDIGTIRIKRSGSDGGHNGLKSIINELGSNMFPRIKIGVGKKPHPDYNQVDWVLGNIAEKDFPKFNESLDSSLYAVQMIIDGKLEEAMNKFNTKPKPAENN